MAKQGSWVGGGLWAKRTTPPSNIPMPDIFRNMSEDEIRAAVKKVKDETDSGIPAQIEAAFPGIGGLSMHPPEFFTVGVREIKAWSNMQSINHGINHNIGIKSVTRHYQIPHPGNTSSP